MSDFNGLAPSSRALGIAQTSVLELVYLIGHPGDQTPPVVSGITPAGGSTITPTTPVAFDVTDTVALRKTIVMVGFASAGVLEVAYDGAAFGPAYAAASSRSVIAGGAHYSLLRAGGWPAADLSVRVVAIDTGGNEAS